MFSAFSGLSAMVSFWFRPRFVLGKKVCLYFFLFLFLFFNVFLSWLVRISSY